MPGPGDALFLALAQAKARPSKALRATEAAGQAGQDIIGGYMGGKEIGQKLEQYKLLSTPLGSMYSDPSQIPFGLSPTHTVKDLLTLAPAMENYVPGNLIRGAASAYGANVGGGGGGASPAPISGPASTVPTPTPGASTLATDQGTSAPPQPPGMSLDIPSGGMGMKGFQNVVLPALKAGQEERQFGQRMGAEESRFQRGQAAEESRFGRGHMATVAGEAGKNLSTTGTIQDDIDQLRNLYKGYQPPRFIGGIGAAITGASGDPAYGKQWMQQGNRISQITPGLGAKINYELTHRFSPGESNLLMKFVAPTPTDNEVNANMKLDNLQRLTSVFRGGDINQINMVASAIAGQPVQIKIPTSTNQGQGAPTNSGTGDPEADAIIQRIQSSSLNPQAKEVRIRAARARARPHGTL